MEASAEDHAELERLREMIAALEDRVEKKKVCIICLCECAAKKGIECSNSLGAAAVAIVEGAPGKKSGGGGGGSSITGFITGIFKTAPKKAGGGEPAAKAAEASNHFCCDDCLEGWTKMSNDTMDLAVLRRRRGKILCPLCPITQNPEEASQKPCRSAFYPDEVLARHVSKEVFASNLAAQFKCVDQETFERVLQEAGLKGVSSIDLLAQQLKRQIPDARQCSKCGFGPVEPIHCADLNQHEHQKVGISKILQWCLVVKLILLSWISLVFIILIN